MSATLGAGGDLERLTGRPRIKRLPITEDAPLSATNPYGQTKLMGEQILADLGAADADWQTACLRYFNPVGAHASGRIGEDPRSIPNNLMQFLLFQMKWFQVFLLCL